MALHTLLVLLHASAATALPALDVRQSPRFSVDIANLLITHGVKPGKFLSSRCSQRLLKITVQARPRGCGFVGYAVGRIDAFRLVGRFVLAIHGGEIICEASADPMFLIESDSALDGGVGEDVTVGEVFRDDAGAGFVFLANLFISSNTDGTRDGVLCGCYNVIEAGGRGDFDLGGSKLGVVEEKSSFGGTVEWCQISVGGVDGTHVL